MKKLTSRRFLLTLLANLAGGYLISKGHVEAGTALIGISGGTYNVGQSLQDAAKEKAAAVAASLGFE